jgi:hypothetical protein
MVAEIRDGLLYIYMPPTDELEHFVDLISRSKRPPPRRVPVVVEGYGPPPDPRIGSMTITPDPGRHRGQRRADGQLRGAEAAAGDPVPSRPDWLACLRSRSMSTAHTAARAVATTSRSEASRPPIRRCCAAPTCWCRC